MTAQIISFPGKVVPFGPGDRVRVDNVRRFRNGQPGTVTEFDPLSEQVTVQHNSFCKFDYHMSELKLIRGRDG